MAAGEQGTLNRGTGVALWRQIQQHLEAQIDSGRFKPGDRLPTEFELAETLSVNRHTVRRALSEMEEKGLLRVEQGRGTFVHEAVIAYNLGKRTRFSANLASIGRTAGHKLLTWRQEEADPNVAKLLCLRKGAPVIVVETLNSADGRPVSYAEHYLAKALFPDIVTHLQESQSLTKAFAAQGIADYERKWTRVTARMPQGNEAELLMQPRSRPVLVTESIDADTTGMPISYGISRFASDWVQLVIEN
ncbi:MAG TPA: phosphonate metabolism transcriptional regulator PhnF [Stellaceae bacterium]|nr:phosphonate metabolism transcriptional regulator PhnF [Stellaceae bacterium]